MKRTKLMVVAVMVVMAILAASVFGFVSIPIARMQNGVHAYPPGTGTGLTLQDAYDYITSSDRDAQMGTIGVLNQRTILLSAGKYTSTSLIFDTDYVNLYGLGDVTITDTSGAVIDCNSKICRIVGVRLDASSIANGLTNDTNATLDNVLITDGSTENQYIFAPNGTLFTTARQTTSSKTTHNIFESVGIVSTKTSGGGAATGATGNENLWLYPEGMFEYHILGTQTILQPVLTTGGVNIALDTVDNDGLEIGQGITAQSKHAYTIGTDAFSLKVKFSIGTINGTDDLAIGFRLVDAYDAVVEDYTDMAALGFNAADGDIMIRTTLNNNSTTNTDTTDQWVDAATHTFEIIVTAGGVVTYLIDGSAPSTTAAFTFDDTDVVVPFLFMLHASSSQMGAVVLQEWECTSR